VEIAVPAGAILILAVFSNLDSTLEGNFGFDGGGGTSSTTMGQIGLAAVYSF